MERAKTQWEENYLHRQEQINAYARSGYQPRLIAVDKILVYPPNEHRRYLQQHPCGGCKAESFCDQPCGAYLKWYNARMEAARARGGGGRR